MWVDVEGATREVLTGADGFLANVDLVLVEVEEIPIWSAGQWLRTDVSEYLATHGLEPIARDQQSRYQFNVLFVSRQRLDDPALQSAFERWRQRLV